VAGSSDAAAASSSASPPTAQPPAAGPNSNSSSKRSALAGFPPKRPQQQQRKQLDINRAVRLLKLTTWRSDNKSTTKLPPYMMRTRDSESPSPPPPSSSNGNGAAGANGNSSRGKLLAAIDTFDDAFAAEQLQMDADDGSSSQEGNMGSRWRSNSPVGGADESSSRSSRSSVSSRRMFSASDPIRRPRSRQGRDEWVLPWQVGAAAAAALGKFNLVASIQSVESSLFSN
jgi:hypothetical protein